MNTPQTRNTLGARWIWLITFLILALPTHAFYQIQDDFTDRSCNLLPNGQVNCVATISQFPRYVQVTNITDDGLGNYTQTTNWKDFTDTFNMVYDPNTFTVNFSNAGDNSFQIALAGIVKNQSGRVYTWAQIHNAFPSFNPVIQIDKNNGYYKWSFNYTIPVAWRNQVDSWGFMFTKDNNTFGVSNNTISFLKAKVDMRQVFDAGWNVSFFNRTMILFDNNTIIQTTGLIDIDPIVSLNLSTSGSMSGYLRANAGGYSTINSSFVRINRDSTAISQSCGVGFTQPCIGFYNFNVTTIPNNATIISINLNMTSLSSNTFAQAFAYAGYASPFYNNGTDNASSFYEWFNATSTFNYTFANISFMKIGDKINFTLSNTTTDRASQDLAFAIRRNDPFNDNFTVSIIPFNISTGTGGYEDFGGSSLAGNAPLLIVNYTAEAPSIMYVSPTPANNTKTVVSWVYNNISASSPTNFSIYNDFNRSLLLWLSMSYYNSTGVFDNSSYNNFALRKTIGGIYPDSYFSNLTQIRGNASVFNGSTVAGNYLEVPDSPTIRTGDNFSASLWFYKINDVGTVRILMKNSTNYGWHLLVAPNAVVISILRNSNGTYYNKSFSGIPITNNTWHHLAFTFDGGTANLYYDGVKATNVPLGISMCSSTQLEIGVTSCGFNFFNGSIDEVMMWNRTLTDQEVNASFEGGMYSYFNNFTSLPNGNYTFKACAIDSFGGTNCTENRTFNIGNSPPFVIHQDPSDQLSYAANTTVNFTSLAYLWESDKLIKNATLYGNFTGTWAINATNTTVLANTSNYSFGSILLGYGTYLWNVFICDTSNQCAFDGNFTVTMTTTTSTTTTTLSNVIDTTFKIGNEFWTMLPFVLLGIAFVLYGFVRGEWLYLVIGSFLLIMWGLTMMNQGYVLVYPMPYNSTGYSCNNTINTTSFPAFNITNASQSCYANQSSRITQVVNNNGTDAMIGFVIMLTGIGGMLYSILLAYEKWTKN